MASAGAGKTARVAVVAIGAALFGFHIIRTAAVADREARPALAAALWPSHPAVLTDRALLAIASAAARGRSVPGSTRADVRRIAVKAPLSPDPFLIEGAIAETEGRGEAAELLLVAARDRDPRSRGTRYLLADRYLRTGRITAGLIEMQVLVGLQSRGVEAFGPAVVAYAREPGAVPQLRGFFEKYPRAEASVLSVLAADAANADLVLALASNDRNPDPDWRGPLISGLAAKGQYGKAYSTWAGLSRLRPSRGVFNPAFAVVSAPPPFNWAYPQSGEGVAEPDGKGGLDILYYGRVNAVLASQLLLLPPGQYRLAMNVAEGGRNEGATHWILRCAAGGKVLGDLPLKAGAVGVAFAVPPGCEAQWLELQGVAGDMPQTTELKLQELRLASETPR